MEWLEELHLIAITAAINPYDSAFAALRKSFPLMFNGVA